MLLLAGGDDVFAATFRWSLPTLLAVMQGLTIGLPFVVGLLVYAVFRRRHLWSPTRCRHELGRRRPRAGVRSRRHGVRWAVGQSVNLGRIAKPRIVALFALTVLAATVLAGPAGPALTLAIVASSALTVGGAAALNNYLERGLDAA